MTRDPVDAIAGAPVPPTPGPSPALEAALATLAPMAPRRPRRQLAILVAASLVYGVGMLAMVSLRRDASELPMMWVIGAALLWLVGFVVPCHIALVPRRGAVLPSFRIAAIAAMVAAVGFVALGLTIHPSGPDSIQLDAARLAGGHACLEVGLATALVPVVIGAVLLRGALPVGARWVAAALGAGAGSLGGLVLHLHCYITDPAHAGLIHGGVVVIAAVLAAALVPRATDLPSGK